jgi:ubiquinone biosynthesis protein
VSPVLGPAEFRALLGRLGPTFVKVGQFLALRPDVLAQEYCDELMQLLDDLPPFPWSEAEAIISADLGASPDELFAHIDREPVAAGSLAQAHLAYLPDGREVAVKILRPGVRKRVRRDLRRIRAIARILELAGVAPLVAPREVAAEVRTWLLQELDLRRELRNMQRLHELSADSPTIHVPRPEPALSGDRVLTAEFIRGVSLARLLAEERAEPGSARARHGFDVDVLAERLMDAVLTQVFRYRFFHADLHPGNLIAHGSDRIGFVDFGLCDELEPSIRENQSRYLAALYERDIRRMYAALSRILDRDEGSDVAGFRRDFTRESRGWLERMPERPARRDPADRQSPIAGWMIATMRTARRHGMRLPPRVLSLYRALLTAESVADQLGGRADLASVGREFFDRLREEEGRLRISRADLEGTAVSAIGLLRDGPDQLQRMLRDASEGRLAIPVEVADPRARARARRRRARMLAAALLSVGPPWLLARGEVGAGVAWTLAALLCALYAGLAVGWRLLR